MLSALPPPRDVAESGVLPLVGRSVTKLPSGVGDRGVRQRRGRMPSPQASLNVREPRRGFSGSSDHTELGSITGVDAL